MSARKITLWMLVPVGVAYIGRVLLDSLNNHVRGPFGSMWWFICPVACFTGTVLAIAALLLAIFASRKAKHPAPAFVLLGGLLLIPFLPLPPLPAPVFPEETFFHEHRAEFEQVVALARQDNLNCLANVGCDVMARELPIQYREFSRDRIVYVTGVNSAHLSVEFHPIDPYYPVVYFGFPEDRNLRVNSECNNIGTTSRYGRKLDEHWYLCVEDWL